jgi:hypothetical protein
MINASQFDLGCSVPDAANYSSNIREEWFSKHVGEDTGRNMLFEQYITPGGCTQSRPLKVTPYG